MNGCQLAVSTKNTPDAITISTTATLITTTTALAEADSLTPKTRSAVTAIVTSTAGTLKMAVTGSPPGTWTMVPGAALSAAGKLRPTWCRSVISVPDHPTATVAAPSAYSRIRSQPMTQATNS